MESVILRFTCEFQGQDLKGVTFQLWIVIVHYNAIFVLGVEIIRKALKVPAMTIVKNTGVEPHAIVEKVAAGEADFGYDALNDQFGNMLANGILDPTKVYTKVQCVQQLNIVQ